MHKKTVMSVLIVLFSGFVILSAQNSGNNVIDLILKSYSAKTFTTIPVSDNEMDLIVKCGIKAPSGMNRQPWKFIVVKDQAITGELLKNITAGNILIIISGQEKEDGTVN
jgi:nitroreductase